jgi:uncharacterized membrane protein YcaP (DUF421 family)
VDIVVRALVIYAFLWLVIRALGKRELSEFTAFELVLLFVVGDLVQQSVTQNDTSISAAILAVSTLAVLIVAQSYIAFRWPRSRKVLEGVPVVVVRDGTMVEEALKLERVSQDELIEQARGHGIADLSRVRVAVLEADGKVSFLSVDGEDSGEGPQEHRAV